MTWMTCTWIRNKGSDTSSDFGGYFRVGSPKVVIPFAPHISVRLQRYRHSHQSVSQDTRLATITMLSTTHLSDKTITMQIQFLLSQLEINCTLGDSVRRTTCCNEGYYKVTP